MSQGKRKKSAKPIKRDKKGRFKKGHTGRPEGAKNKTPANLVQKILEIDGQLTIEGKGLIDCARQAPQWFYEKILTKVIPKNIELGGSGEAVKFEIIKRYELPKSTKDDTV